jgi:hypothetical protein
MKIIKRNFRIPFFALNKITRRQLANNERSNKISLSNDCQHVRQKRWQQNVKDMLRKEKGKHLDKKKTRNLISVLALIMGKVASFVRQK